MPRLAESDLGLLCLPMCYKKDARLIWVTKISPFSIWKIKIILLVFQISGNVNSVWFC